MSTFSQRGEGGVGGHTDSSQNHFVKPSVPLAADAAFQILHACLDPFQKVMEEGELSGSPCTCSVDECYEVSLSFSEQV